MRRSEAHAGRTGPHSVNRVLRWLAAAVGLVLLAALAGAGPAAAAENPYERGPLVVAENPYQRSPAAVVENPYQRGPAAVAENPYQRGPDPTRDSVAASRGTFATASVKVPEGNGFTKGVIYYPTDTSQGTFGAIAFVPGYHGSWAALEWTGPWLASFGFVVIGFEAINPGDRDTARGTQLLAALDYLTGRSPVRDRIDPNRTAVIGHSMGGGGAMSAASRRPSLKTAIGLAPAIFSTDMRTIRVPTMLMAGQNDGTVTPSYVKNFYDRIPGSTEKAYLELTGAGHGFPSWTPNSVMMRKVIPWFKVFVDNDARYSQFLCPLMDWTGIRAYQSTCPLLPGGPTPTHTR